MCAPVPIELGSVASSVATDDVPTPTWKRRVVAVITRTWAPVLELLRLEKMNLLYVPPT